MKYSQLVAVLFLCISMIACDDDDINSNQLSTDSFVANLHVTNGGTGVTAIEAQLRDITTSSFIDLKDGDRLLSSTIGPVDSINFDNNLFTNLAQSADQVKLMTGSFANAGFPSSLLNFTDEVSGSLYGDNNIDNRIYTITLERPIGENASDSSVTLPTGFSITAPQTDMSFSRSADAINISWSPIDDSATINITASLNHTSSFVTEFNHTLPSDTGFISIPAGTFTTPSGNFTLRIILDRFQSGTIDPHYALGSQITGHQKRFVDVVSVP